MYISGRSYSDQYPKGRRRQKDGVSMAPKAIRKRFNKTFLSECSEAELKKYSKL